jgi:hypothetical protein
MTYFKYSGIVTAVSTSVTITPPAATPGTRQINIGGIYTGCYNVGGTGAAFRITIVNNQTGATVLTFVSAPAERFSYGGSVAYTPPQPITLTCPPTGLTITVVNRNAADNADVSATGLTLTVVYSWR